MIVAMARTEMVRHDSARAGSHGASARARRRRDLARRATRPTVRTWAAWFGLVHEAATVVVPISTAADRDRIIARDHVRIIAGAA